MKEKLSITFSVLILFTIVGAFLSGLPLDKTIVVTIVILSVIKFLLVAFHFMELKNAHFFWKFILVFYVLLLSSIFFIFL